MRFDSIPADRHLFITRRPGGRLWRWALAAVSFFVAALCVTDVLAGNFARAWGTPGAGAETFAVASDGNGNVFVGGTFTGATLSIGGTTLTRTGASDGFVAKFDADGNALWASAFGGPGASMWVTALAVAADGSLRLGGEVWGGDLATPALATLGTRDTFAIALDGSGNVAWSRRFGGAVAWAYATGIAADAAGNVFLGGYFGAANLTTPALTRRGNDASGVTYDAYVLKLDASGNLAWALNFGGPGATAAGTGLVVDGAGNLLVCGVFGGASLTVPALSPAGLYDAFAAKLDTGGNAVWVKRYGGPGASVVGSRIAVDAAGNAFLGGIYATADLTVPALARLGVSDSFAMRLDGAGDPVWARRFGGAGADTVVNGIAVDGGGNVHLGGYFSGANLTLPALSRQGQWDALAIKLDIAGNTVRARSFGGTGATVRGYGLDVDANGDIVLGGTRGVAPFAVPPLAAIGTTDAFVIREATVPVATTGAASSLTASGATLGGQVDTSGVEVTAIAFDVGPTPAYGLTFLASPVSLGAGAGATAVLANTTGLACGTTYHYRARATHAVGSVVGADATFTTAACPVIGACGSAAGVSVAVAPAANLCAAGTASAVTPGASWTWTCEGAHGGSDATCSAPVGSLAQSITFDSLPGRTFGEAPFAVTASASSGLAVTLASATPAVCRVAGGLVTLRTAGTCTVNADQPGNGTWLAAARVTRSFGVGCNTGDMNDCDADGIPNAVELAEGRDPLVKDNDVFTGNRLFAMQQYRDFLGREGEEAGIQGWAQYLGNGTFTRTQVIDQFLGSAEFGGVIAPVVRLYFATFLRVPDYAGMTYNAGLVRVGAITTLQLAEFFTASPEFAARYGALDNTAFVTLLYNNVLGRAPDQAGLDGWLALMAGGMTRGQVLQGFSDSPEYSAAMANEVLVTMMYAGMLRRTPETAGFAGWVAALDAGSWTRAQVIQGFLDSAEYRGRFLP